jgi:GMP synthase (glutamine-hydrolysing)
MSEHKPLLVIQHVPWEGPHRILDAFAGAPIHRLEMLEGNMPLPCVSEVCGAVIMGGPMSANDTDRHPRLAEELGWLAQAVDSRLPILGVCLGSQLLARALGARVSPGPVREIGFAPIEVLDQTDSLVGPLAPESEVLHWHGEVFELPPGAVPLARSAATELQAFRFKDHAWGLLFHAEADAKLGELWLTEPTMAKEAQDHLGSEYAAILRAGAARVDPRAGERVFAAFAQRCGIGVARR